MPRAQRNVNIIAVFVPFIGFLAAIGLLWNEIVGWTDLAIFAGMYAFCGLGITIGFHRYLTHKSFATSKPLGYALAIAGSMAVQGPVISWVADHRKHHAHTDEEGDPHSPHVGVGKGFVGAVRGLWYAHVGWLWTEQGRAKRRKYAADLYEDKGFRAIDRAFEIWVLLGLAIPFVLGFAITGEIKGAFTALLWGGFVRIFLLHHITWSINSVCHFFGRRRFALDDHSTNVFWLALPSLGEAWHHNHHAFPRAANHGLKRSEIDVSGTIIGAMEKVGLVWNVVRITPERQEQKLAETAARPSVAA